MNVGIDYIADSHSARLSCPEVEVRIINWVAHGGQPFAASTEHV